MFLCSLVPPGYFWHAFKLWLHWRDLTSQIFFLHCVTGPIHPQLSVINESHPVWSGPVRLQSCSTAMEEPFSLQCQPSPAAVFPTIKICKVWHSPPVGWKIQPDKVDSFFCPPQTKKTHLSMYTYLGVYPIPFKLTWELHSWICFGSNIHTLLNLCNSLCLVYW